ncbi:hypothetical protein [uncultured Campylobacter sp.]|uniref:hypothetical protein n=1 Tax=uncultured Campylobacter sp. TaxID=218934 RepID=UPI00260FED10|nr:hypothetical protein [uncultured Campylobacter sp.]
MIAIRYKSMVALRLEAAPKVKFRPVCAIPFAAILSVNKNQSDSAVCALYLRKKEITSKTTGAAS